MGDTQRLIGRTAEIRQIRNSLECSRVVAIVGEGGVGKTTLAHHIATEYAADYPGGVHFVEYNATSRSSEGAIGPLLETIGKETRQGQKLLVIDGIDTLSLDITADLLKYAVSIPPDVKILITSRHPVPGAGSNQILGRLTDDAVSEFLGQIGLVGRVASNLVAALRGSPLAMVIVGSLVQRGVFKPDELIKYLHEFQTSGIVLPNGRDLDVREEPTSALRLEVVNINDQLLRSLDKDISLVRELSSRKFEELVAELLTRQGYKVSLTPASKDGGKDIYVARRDDLGAFLYLVECKKYALDNPVGVEIVRALYGTVQAECATAGVLVTTSVFTKGARDFQRHIQYQLSLRDYVELHRWIGESLHYRGNT